MKLTEEQIKVRDIFNSRLKSKEYTLIDNPCICGNKNDVLIAKKDRYGIDLTTKLCLNCGLVRSDPYYDTDTLNLFYANDYRALYTNNSKPSNDFFDDEVKMGEYIIKTLKGKFEHLKFEELNVFEVGCGGGGILYPFYNKGSNVYGCDLGDDYLEIGRNKGMTLVNGDIESLEQFGQADIIILHHVLEHFVDPIERLQKAISLLKQDGILYVAVPGLWPHPRTYGTIKEYLQNAHVYSFTLSTLSNLLARLGMKELYGSERVVGIYMHGATNSIKKENISKLKNLLMMSIKFPWLFNLYSRSIKLYKRILINTKHIK